MIMTIANVSMFEPLHPSKFYCLLKNLGGRLGLNVNDYQHTAT